MNRSNLLKKVSAKLNPMMDKSSALEKSLWQDLLAKTRLLYLWYQTCHWKTKGVTFYADHLLFERLYKDTLVEIDEIAERSIGTTGDIDTVDLVESLDKIQKELKSMKKLDLLEGSLYLETNYLELLKKSDVEKEISIGTRDLINGIANKHEEHIYLLKQRSSH